MLVRDYHLTRADVSLYQRENVLLPSVLDIVNQCDLSFSTGHAEHPFKSRKLNVDRVAAA